MFARPDYANRLLYGPLEHNLQRLQQVYSKRKPRLTFRDVINFTVDKSVVVLVGAAQDFISSQQGEIIIM